MRMSRRPHGRSLIELMISITIGFIVLAAILAIYAATNQTNRQTTLVGRMSEDSAVAINFIGNNLRMAGFSPLRVSVSPGKTVIVNGETVQFPDRHFVGAAVRGCDNGFTSNSAAFDSLSCATGTGPAAFALRFEGDVDSTPSIVVSGVAYPSDCLSQAVTTNATSAYDGSAYPLVESRFWVQTTSTAVGPELYCGGNGGAANFTGLPVVEGVESMVVLYGVASDTESNQITNYLTAAQVNALAGSSVDARWGRVVSLQICLVMRSTTPDQNGAAAYTDCAGNTVTPTDGRSRRSFTTVYALRNRTGV
jgi:type IV pilus assembly protein PilW